MTGSGRPLPTVQTHMGLDGTNKSVSSDTFVCSIMMLVMYISMLQALMHAYDHHQLVPFC